MRPARSSPLSLSLLVVVAACWAALAGAQDSDQPVVVVDKFALPPLAVRYAKTDTSVVQAFSEPNANTTGSFTYWANRETGVELKAGQKLVFQVPDDFAHSDRIDSVVLIHRKDSTSAATRSIKTVTGKWKGKTVTYKWDREPAFMVVSCRRRDTGEWVPWRGPGGPTHDGEPREYNDPDRDERRYSEPRDAKNPLFDALPDFAKWLGRMECDLMSVQNKGYGGAASSGFVHGITVQYRPMRGNVLPRLDQLHQFSPSTVFADPEFTHRLVPHLGGGIDFEPEEADRLHTIYPNAEAISMATVDTNLANTFKVVEPWLRVTAGGMIVRARPGHLLAGCDIALGDSKYLGSANASSQTDNDGQLGSRGGSLVSVFMRHPNSTGTGENMTVIIGSTRWMVQKYDVQAASVMSVSPPDWDDIRIPTARDPTNPWSSSFVRVDAEVDPAYIMAVRCRYYDPATVRFPPPKPAPKPTGAALTNGVSSNSSSAVVSNATESATNSTSGSTSGSTAAPPSSSTTTNSTSTSSAPGSSSTSNTTSATSSAGSNTTTSSPSPSNTTTTAAASSSNSTTSSSS